MAEPDDPIEREVAALAEVLIRVASGDFDARAPRSDESESLDALAYMINATVEEVGELVRDAERQRDEVRLAHAQLMHASQLTLLGELASGVAHELRQPLTAMVMLVEAARQTGRLEGASLELLASSVAQMSRIVESIQKTSRRAELELSTIEAAAPVRDAVALFETLTAGGIHIRQELADALPTIDCDAVQLHQVLVNLLVNARDAVRATDDAEIVVRARARDEAVEYVVEDNGPGVPDDVRPRLFERFFTTKAAGGTGLGLALSRDIVVEHGGTLHHEPRPGGGARFVIRIPLATGP